MFYVCAACTCKKMFFTVSGTTCSLHVPLLLLHVYMYTHTCIDSIFIFLPVPVHVPVQVPLYRYMYGTIYRCTGTCTVQYNWRLLVGCGCFELHLCIRTRHSKDQIPSRWPDILISTIYSINQPGFGHSLFVFSTVSQKYTTTTVNQIDGNKVAFTTVNHTPHWQALDRYHPSSLSGQ